MRIRRLFPLLIVAGLGLFFLAHRLHWLQAPETVATQAGAVASGGVASVTSSLQRLWDTATGHGTLRRELERTQQALIASERGRADQTLNAEESAAVAHAQSVLGERNWQGTIARVIGRSPDPTLRVALINRGTNHGVRVHAAVIAGEGVLIGRVIEADAATAKVLYSNDPQSSVTAFLNNTAKTEGVLRGAYGVSQQLQLLKKTDSIEVGQLVMTAGLDDGVPRGLLLGQIESVSNLPGELFQSATVTPLLDPRSETVVTVIASPNA